MTIRKRHLQLIRGAPRGTRLPDAGPCASPRATDDALLEYADTGGDALRFLYCDPAITSLYGEPVV